MVFIASQLFDPISKALIPTLKVQGCELEGASFSLDSILLTTLTIKVSKQYRGSFCLFL